MTLSDKLGVHMERTYNYSRDIRLGWMMAVSAFALLLNFTIWFAGPSGGGPDSLSFSALFFILSLLPYGITLVLLAISSIPISFSLPPAILMMTNDSYLYYAVFIAPGSSTAALGYLVQPVINMIIVLPAGLLSGLIIHRTLGRSTVQQEPLTNQEASNEQQ